MLNVFHRYLPKHSDGPAGGWDDVLAGIVWGMNGQPTITQMARFADVASEYGASVPSEGELLREFQSRLDERIAERLALIRSGHNPDEFVIHGARPLLEYLRGRGLTLVILSSTVEHRVRDESEALLLSEFFGERIYGSPVDPSGYTKLAVLQRLVGLESERLLSFGDGPVEIAATKRVGGLAIAVCTDEDRNGSGCMDEKKRELLVAAGADVAIPDYRDAIPLVQYLLGR